MKMSPYFLICICFFTVVAGASESCIDLLADYKNDHTIWRTVTGRDHNNYMIELETLNDAIRRSGLNLPEFEHSKGQNILSLGEGESNFIDDFLSREGGGVYHAVDAQSSPGFLHYQRKWPENYHNTYFQEMHLKDSNGQRILFDEILSSWSLGFVISEALPGQAKSVLLNVVNHLKVDGVLRVWPVMSLTKWRGALGDLQLLDGFSYTSEVVNDDDLGAYTIMIKKISEKDLKVYFIRRVLI